MKIQLFMAAILGAMTVSPGHAGGPQPGNSHPGGSDIYRFATTYPNPASDIEITTTTNGTGFKTLKPGVQIPATMVLTGGRTGDPEFIIDGLGSHDIKIAIDKTIGYTEYGGLKFQDEAIVGITRDGTVQVDREGVRATDAKGRHWISQKRQDGETPIIVFGLQSAAGE